MERAREVMELAMAKVEREKKCMVNGAAVDMIRILGGS